MIEQLVVKRNFRGSPARRFPLSADVISYPKYSLHHGTPASGKVAGPESLYRCRTQYPGISRFMVQYK